MFKCCGSKDNQAYQVQKYENGQLKTQYVKNVKKLKQTGVDQMVVRVQKSEYDDLIKKYKGDKKFTDQTFPPNSKSLGSIDQVPQDCQWRRISQIVPNAQLFVEGINPTDVVQGSLNDCYFLAALAALGQNDERIRNVFGNQSYNPNGIYKVTLRIDGVIQEIVVDDYIPVNKRRQPLFCNLNKNQFWVVLLEKAWAKAHGSYANIENGTPTEVFKAVTYAPSQIEPIKNDQQSRNKLWQQIHQHAHKDHPCCAGTRDDESLGWQQAGLDPKHAYTLLDAAQVSEQNGDLHRMVKLRNPWGKNQWTGEGSQNDHGFWARIRESDEKNRFLSAQKKGNDGVFYMRYEDFCQYFLEVHFCHLIKSPKYETQKLYCDKKHGSIYNFNVTKQGNYILQLHQSGIRGQDEERLKQGLNRSTLVLAKGENYEFIDGSLKYQAEDNSLQVNLDPGKYYIYAKIDPTLEKGIIPEDMLISCYSQNFIDLEPTDRKKHKDFFKKVFLSYARVNRRKQYDDKKMWISWKLLYTKGGYAFLAFGVDSSSDKKFVIDFDEKDFTDANYILKKPHKGKGKQNLEIKPGQEQIIVARVKNGPLQTMKFPVAFDIKIDKV